MRIYYFSATGNSLVVARDIARYVHADLMSIPKALQADEVRIDSGRAGIVFPSYLAALSGLPLIAERFIGRIVNIESVEFFAICTCGGYESVNAFPALRKLRRLIKERGGKLSAEYSVRLPMNNLDYDHIPVPITRNSDLIIQNSKRKIDDISRRVQMNRGTKFKIPKNLFSAFISAVYEKMRPAVVARLRDKAQISADAALTDAEIIALTDRSILVDGHCTGCGTCAKVCPVRNIKIVEKRPEFQHRCEMCFACDEWCPSKAVHHWSRAAGVKYHHPEVEITDIY